MLFIVATVFVNTPIENCVPIALSIVPISNEQNRPCAIAPNASTPYLFKDISISFLLRKPFIFSIKPPINIFIFLLHFQGNHPLNY